MKKIVIGILLVLLLAGGIAAWIFLGSGTDFSAPRKALYIRSSAATKEAVMDSLEKNGIVGNAAAFAFLANRFDYWKHIRPGKYEIKQGSSLLSIVRMLRNGQQTPVDLVITKLRTKEDLARLVGRRLEPDTAAMLRFLNDKDSLGVFDANSETAMWRIVPDTYTYYWTATPAEIYTKIAEASKDFWTEERRNKAAALNLTPTQVVTLASIIEEETTRDAEKDTIASVYLNRLRIGMPLQADPTLKFATRNFALKRIAGEILDIVSPYNTYRNKGLPPGPICTPSRLTVDKVLNPATTTFIYFVAKPKLGGHLYSTTYEEHLRKRADYLAADKIRQEGEKKTSN